MQAMLKRRTLSAKTITESQYSQIPLYGRLWRRIETMPVPIVTENHLHSVRGCLGAGGGYGRWGEVADYSSPASVVF